MPASDFLYDPYAESEDNMVLNEVHNYINRGIFPTANSFYKKDLKVEGFNGTTWIVLNEGVDFTFSPWYIEVSAATGNQAFTYIVILADEGTYSRIRLSYRAVGVYYDRNLLNALAASTFDRSSLTGWFAIKNQYTAMVSHRPEDLEGKGIMEVLNTVLTQINTSLQEMKDVGGIDVQTRIQNLEQQMDSLLNP